MKIKTIDKFTIKGRGDVYTLSLKENNLSNDSKEIKKLLSTEIEINDKKYQIIGVEAFHVYNGVKDNVGFLVKEI